MHYRFTLTLTLTLAIATASPLVADGLPIEEPVTDPNAVKIVLIAGSNYFKPGEHEYVAACAVLRDLLRQSPNVAPVIALDWPKKPETFQNAKAVLFLFDGGDKHALLKENRFADVQKMMDAGVGLIQLHQVIDIPKDFGDRVRGFAGGAWEKGYSARAHWVSEFQHFNTHPIFRGVTPFKLDDGWLTKLRFAEGMNGVTPLLKAVSPKAKPAGDADVVAWAFERTNGGRTFNFTGTHLHASFAEEGYRRFLTNGILWAAKQEIPASGAPVKLDKPLTAYQQTKK
jgi:Trehalose utilisation